MGCGLSKKDGANDVVSICRERRLTMKMLVEQRQAFAVAHYKYIHSLSALSSAIRVFIARHSSAPSYPISFPSPTSPKLTSGNAHEAPDAYQPDDSTASSDSFEVGEKDGVCEFFYGDNKAPPPMPPPERESGWDFFNLFDSSGLETVRLLREREGIPELEEDTDEDSGKRKKAVKKMKKNGDLGKVKETTVIEKQIDGSELMEALKEIEENFFRAYESGLDVSRMLEVSEVHHQSGLEQIKENSSKIMESIVWNRPVSTQSSPCKSLLSYSSKTTSPTWTECRSDLFDAGGGMDSGSHSSTLARLYAWERKLFKEVKAGDMKKKSYQQKCSQLRKHGGGEDELGSSKARAEATDLYNRILVSRRSADSIAKRIEKLRDDELQPQLLELLRGLMRTWKTMLESHKLQEKAMFRVKSFGSRAGNGSNESLRLATLKLGAALQCWHACFSERISMEKAYVKSLHGWLSKLTDVETEIYPMPARASRAAFQTGGRGLLVACQGWLVSLERLPDRAVERAIKSLAMDVRSLWAQQGEEQQQKKKVDGIAEETERRAFALRKEGLVVTRMKTPGETVRVRVDCLGGEKEDSVDRLRKRLEFEKSIHHGIMDETKRMVSDGLRVGFSSVFESMIDFSKASVKLYADLVIYCEDVGKGVE
ncbi:hypothetical protein Nepgr_025847 [Nepenthes gracilis]|uniref:Nitrate regulatory gene2 protein n=1 Tax=Nepenthes gracilis TaxID=150966 RepID=A0AAD3T7U7_NEPGR|nr:hypothetical protein Nepgr_025847 [Nepenthes gracilis]